MRTHYEEYEQGGWTYTEEEHVISDDELSEVFRLDVGEHRLVGRVTKLPSKAAQRRQARKQIQDDLDELGDL